MLPIGDALAAPPPQGPATAGPPVPEKVEENKGLWRGFFDRIKTDPNFKQAVLQTGLGMMRSQQPGENALDVASQSLGTGVATLDMLRERDRQQKIADAERVRKGDVEERQTKATEQVAATGTKRAGTEETSEKSRYDILRDELNEAKRHNMKQEEIDMIEARAAGARAAAYTSTRAGKTPQDIQKINILSAKYQRDLGVDPVDGDALALQYIQETGKQGTAGSRISSMVEMRMKAYNEVPQNWGKPIDDTMIRQWTQDAINTDTWTQQQLNPTNMPAPGGARNIPEAGVFGAAPELPFASSADIAATPVEPAASAPAMPPASATAPPAAPAANLIPRPPPNPQMQQFIQSGLSRGLTREQIAARLKELGYNPADYGF